MYKKIVVGKYEIEFSKNIPETRYTIYVLYDNKTLKVEAIQTITGEYEFEIMKATRHKDHLEIIRKELYGKKFKKNFETMKILFKKIFP